MSPKSKLPPRVLRRMANMRETDRKVYAAQLLGSYQSKAAKHRLVGKRMAQTWVENQGKAFENICEELIQVIHTGDMPGDSDDGTRA